MGERDLRDGGAVTIDVYRLSREGQVASGRMDFSEIAALDGHAGEFHAGEVSWEAEGCEGSKGMPGARLRVRGWLEGVCSRCGGPLRVDIDTETDFLFAASEQAADALPVDGDGDYEVSVASDKLDAASWVGEEVVLRLPTFPVHDDCEAPRLSERVDGEKKESPFAALARLKKV